MLVIGASTVVSRVPCPARQFAAASAQCPLGRELQAGSAAAPFLPRNCGGFLPIVRERHTCARRGGKGISPAQAERPPCCPSSISRSVVGSPETVRRGTRQLVEATGADELIVAAAIHDHVARLRSYEILAGAVASE